MKKKANKVSVFAPRIICGEEVEPFCLPTSGTATSEMMAAATNLVWWAMHESLADGKIGDAHLCGKILIDIVTRELTEQQRLEAEEIVDEVFEKYRDITENNN